MPTLKRRRLTCRQGQRRYGRVSIGRVSAVRDKTTKPVKHEIPWPVAPRTADGRMGARVCDQGPHHETCVVCRRAAVDAGRNMPAEVTARTTESPPPNSLIALPAGVVGVFLSGDGYCTQGRTTSPCGGRRSLFFASAKKTNEKKADPAGGRAIRLSSIDDFVVRPGVPAGFCRYRVD